MTKHLSIWFAILAFLGFAAFVPVWIHFVNVYAIQANVSAEFQWLVTFTLPAALILYLAGWVEPRSD